MATGFRDPRTERGVAFWSSRPVAWHEDRRLIADRSFLVAQASHSDVALPVAVLHEHLGVFPPHHSFAVAAQPVVGRVDVQDRPAGQGL